MDVFYKPLLSFPDDDSIAINPHYKACYAIVKDNHIYTCNVHLKELHQRFNKNVDEDIQKQKIKVIG